MRVAILLSISLLILVIFSGCRGWTSEEPPVHLNPNMDTQIKYKPYRKSDFFEDGRDMRPMLEGVVARGKLKDDDHFYRGMVDGQPAKTFPISIEITKEFIERGHNRFNVYCTSCHAKDGSGTGMVGRRLKIHPTDFHTDYLRNQPVGHFFDVITHGIRTMPSYGLQVADEKDRWAIIAYIRALQYSQNPDDAWLKTSMGK